jgi:hypothetical protein
MCHRKGKVNKKAAALDLGFSHQVYKPASSVDDSSPSLSDFEQSAARLKISCIEFFEDYNQCRNEENIEVTRDESESSRDFNTGLRFNLSRDFITNEVINIPIKTIKKWAMPNNNSNEHNTLNHALSSKVRLEVDFEEIGYDYDYVEIGYGDDYERVYVPPKLKYGFDDIKLLLENTAIPHKPSNKAEPSNFEDEFNTINIAIINRHSLRTIQLLLENNAKPSNSNDKFNTINIAIINGHSFETIQLLLENNAKPSNSNDKFNTAKILYSLCHKRDNNEYRNFQNLLIEYCLLNTIKLLLPSNSLHYLFFLDTYMLKIIFASKIYGSIEYNHQLESLMIRYPNEGRIDGFMIRGDTDSRLERYQTVDKYVKLLTNPAKSLELQLFAIELDSICEDNPRKELKQMIPNYTNIFSDGANIVYEYASEFPQNGFWLKIWNGEISIDAATATDSAAAVPDLATAVPDLAATGVPDLTAESDLATATAAVTAPASYLAAAQTKVSKKYIKYKMKYIALKKKIMNI